MTRNDRSGKTQTTPRYDHDSGQQTEGGSRADLLGPVSKTTWKETSEEAAEIKEKQKVKGKCIRIIFN